MAQSYPGQSTTSQARDTMERAGDTAANAAKSMSRDMSSAVGQAADMAQEQLDGMTRYVRKNPLQATAIAAGVGFVFALIARR
jgi:ElaB/YqjD/DUF883 family membrane-anchored ribosome-binding protein